VKPKEIIAKLKKPRSYVVADFDGAEGFTLADKPDDTPFILVSLELRDAIIATLQGKGK
jgi:hypothetical protein